MIDVALGGGRRTTARLFPATSPTGVLLVLGHGAGAGQSHSFMMAAAGGLAVRGIDVVTFDFPYMHDGRRVPDKAPVLEEAFRVVIAAACAQSDVTGRRLFIGGKSMGGRIATHLGAQGLDNLRGLVVFGYPLHPPAKPTQLRTAHLPRVGVPLLVVQGEHDPFGTPVEFEPVLAIMSAEVTFHAVPGADHSLYRRGDRGGPPDGVLDVARDWLVRTADGRDIFSGHSLHD
jgi:predicted alpha/beta-hydrolase family hydrolase